MKLTSLYNDGDLSSIKVSNPEQTVQEVRNLLFHDQLLEEQIALEINSANTGVFSDVDELRLDFDRIWSKRQVIRKTLFFRKKWMDSAKLTEEVPVEAILSIKAEERYLNAKFKDIFVLAPGALSFGKKEIMFFARLKNNNFYLLGTYSIAH